MGGGRITSAPALAPTPTLTLALTLQSEGLVVSGEALRREKLRLKIRQDEEGLREITRIRVS